MACLLSLISACGGGAEEVLVAGPADLGHIHDLALDDDGSLLVASHLGLYRVEDVDRAVLIGSARHDLMSMTRLESGDLIASGHPDLRSEDYRREGLPPHFGLVESTDLGETWTVTGGLGENDFHALAPTVDGVYAAEATTKSIWLLASSGEWEQRGELEARDLAVDPSDPSRQIAADFEAEVWASSDGAYTWNRLSEGPSLLEIEWVDGDELYGIDEAGAIWGAPDFDGKWAQIASGPGGPKTFYVVDPDHWWVATHGGRIFRTENAGVDWVDVYMPPTES